MTAFTFHTGGDIGDSTSWRGGLSFLQTQSNGQTLLETNGLTIADVDIKVMPFTQMAIAMRNKAIDAAIVIPPFTSQFLDQGFAVSFKEPDDLVKPHPMTIAS